MKFQVTESLQNTLLSHPLVDKVYFDATGRYYFNAHLLIEKKGSEKKKLYGQGEYSHSQLIPGEANYDKLTEQIAKGVAETLIVETVSREDILKASPKMEGNSILAQILALPEDERAALAALFSQAPAQPSAPAKAKIN